MGRSIVMHIDEAPWTKGGPYRPGSGPIPRATQLIGDLDEGPWVHIHCLEPNLVVSPHTHDQDEVAFIVEGELTIEGRKCGPGTVLFNEKDTEYGFTVGPNGVRFLNIRQGLAKITIGGQTHDSYRNPID